MSDEVTLTAYIAASFLEMKKPVDVSGPPQGTAGPAGQLPKLPLDLIHLVGGAKLPLLDLLQDPVVQKSLSCLKASITNDGLANIYTTTLMAYVFTLAGDLVTRGRLLDHLSTKAKSKGGSVSSWTRVDLGSSGTQLLCVFVGDLLYWEQAPGEDSPSLAVEISAYRVLAQLSANPTLEDLGYATRIIRWISTQQNYYGGFYSTQVGVEGGDLQDGAHSLWMGVCRTRWWPSRLWLSAPG